MIKMEQLKYLINPEGKKKSKIKEELTWLKKKITSHWIKCTKN